MSGRAFLIEVRLLDGRYHGVGDWPPSPFRLFQALVAGAYGGRWGHEPREAKDAAFRWLEGLTPPHITAPVRIEGRATTYYVPHNDADTTAGNPALLPKIRAAKQLRPLLLPFDVPLLYAWPFDEGEEHAKRLCDLAERLHTLGRGIDPAFALAELSNWDELAERFAALGRVLTRPTRASASDDDARCPTIGSFDSLVKRHGLMARRFETQGHGRSLSTLFRQPTKGRCRYVAYDSPPARLLFELRPVNAARRFQPVVQNRAVDLATAVRDLAARRLIEAFPGRAGDIERVIIGRGAGRSNPLPRVRILPLPSIGAAHADRSIRRVLIQVPQACPLTVADVSWAVSGQVLREFDVIDITTGAVQEETALVSADDDLMLQHYGVGDDGYRQWRTVTPAALPARGQKGGRSGSARIARQHALSAAAIDALRHAGFDTRGVTVRVQREPFHLRGLRADLWAAGRFAANSLHHVAVTFPRAVSGPVLLGDGRWLGLGVMAPEPEVLPSLYVFRVGRVGCRVEDGPLLARAVRRAVMARAGRKTAAGALLPAFFTGHNEDGTPASSSSHQHLFFLADDDDGDGVVDRIAIVAPHLADRHSRSNQAQLAQLADALEEFAIVRAGRLGIVELERSDSLGMEDAVFGAGRQWISRTDYRPTRHPRPAADVQDGLTGDISDECLRRGLPRPSVEVVDVAVGPRGGIKARLRLTFAVSVKGPLMLGAGSHFGEGAFARDPAEGVPRLRL